MVSYEAKNIDKHVQKALSALDDNCSLLGLKISVDKTKIMHFLIGKDPPNATPFTLQGTPLEQVPTYKYLGVHFDRFLHFRNHINKRQAEEKNSTCWNHWRDWPGGGANTEDLIRYVNACMHPIAKYGTTVMSASLHEPYTNKALAGLATPIRAGLKLHWGYRNLLTIT